MEDGAKIIISDYRRESRSFPIRWWAVSVIEILIYVFTGMFLKEDLRRILAVGFSVIFVGMSLYVTLDVMVFEPQRFKRRLNAFPENERDALLEQYEKAPMIGKRRFLEEYLICFFNMRIVLLKYSEIRSAELKGYNLLLDIGGKKPIKMPFDADENPAVIVAALRSRNSKISVIINGKVVDRMENK